MGKHLVVTPHWKAGIACRSENSFHRFLPLLFVQSTSLKNIKFTSSEILLFPLLLREKEAKVSTSNRTHGIEKRVAISDPTFQETVADFQDGGGWLRREKKIVCVFLILVFKKKTNQIRKYFFSFYFKKIFWQWDYFFFVWKEFVSLMIIIINKKEICFL